MNSNEVLRQLADRVMELEVGALVAEVRLLGIMESLGLAGGSYESPGGELGVDTAQADLSADDR